MSNRVIYDATGGVIRSVEYENPDDILEGKFTVVTEYDSTPYVDYTKDVAEHAPFMDENGTIFRHVRTIPPDVFERACREGWDKDDWLKWYNDTNFKKLWSYGGTI